MPESSRHDAWQAGDSYDRYMGRWSRELAPRFRDAVSQRQAAWRRVVSLGIAQGIATQRGAWRPDWAGVVALRRRWRIGTASTSSSPRTMR